jgi:hypothetical protein
MTHPVETAGIRPPRGFTAGRICRITSVCVLRDLRGRRGPYPANRPCLRREALDLAEVTGWDPRRIERNICKTVPAIYW